MSNAMKRFILAHFASDVMDNVHVVHVGPDYDANGADQRVIRERYKCHGQRVAKRYVMPMPGTVQ